MPKVTHFKIDGELYDVQHLTPDTQAQLVEDLPSAKDLNAVLKNYKVKKVS